MHDTHVNRYVYDSFMNAENAILGRLSNFAFRDSKLVRVSGLPSVASERRTVTLPPSHSCYGGQAGTRHDLVRCGVRPVAAVC